MKRFLLLVLVVVLSGCTRNAGTIRAGGATVLGPADAGKGATLDASDEVEVLEIPAGSTVKVTEYAAQPAAVATKDAPAVEAQPARKVTEVILTGTTNWRRNKATVKADTGTVDTSVAKHRIDVAERRWLLWVAIGCGIGGVVAFSMLPQWPSLGRGLLMAAALAGASWKLAEVPVWIWMVVLAVVALLILGYKRAEWDKDGDGIPDVLQKKKKKK